MRFVDDTRLYTIGELARRTGLSIRTIRFYSDSGLVPPTDRTASGYRLYDVSAMSRLELVRTLRELGAGLDEVTDVLNAETTLSSLAMTHLDLLENQLRVLRTRRAVLRAVVKQGSTTGEARLMHKLANYSDAERNRIIDEFWDDVTTDLELNPEFERWIRSVKPALPDDPSSDQVEAWIELAELVRTPDFRQAVRALYQEMSERRGAGDPTESQTPEAAREYWVLLSEVRSAFDAGVASDSARARELADRAASTFAEGSEPDSPELRGKIADRLEEDYDPRIEHYWALLGTINGWPQQDQLGPAAKWLADALRASAR